MSARIGAIDVLRERGVLSPLDDHFARTMERIAADHDPDVLLAAAMLSRAVSNGHVCLDLARLTETPPVDAAGEPVAGITWPLLGPWRERLRKSPLTSNGAADAPLVLDDAGRLYLRRYWEHETRLGAALHARAVDRDDGVHGATLVDGLDRLFPASRPADGADEVDWQRVAAAVAVLRRFCVISGGPGTGKTFTVVKILALLVEQALRSGARPPRVTLLAPTGKAAARLSESIRRGTQDLACADAVKRAIAADAATIHRRLGSVHGSDTRFRYAAAAPLLTEVVVVDEASMVDLALMRRLVDAVPPQAHLILLGDKDQLASVEAGAVLGDICNTGAPRSCSAAWVQHMARLTGDRLPVGPQAPRQTGMWDCVVQLTHSYRYRAESGIGALARAINEGDSAAALAVLESGDNVGLVEPPRDGSLGGSLRDAVVHGFAPYLRAVEPAAAVQELERFRVLCAHRRGRAGVQTVNQKIEAALGEAGLLNVDATWYRGRPLIVTRNDYQLDLFNGDVGVVLDDPDGRGGTMVFFDAADRRPGSDGALRRISPSRLPPHETVFAMSVHKSQGSEFDHVALLLPLQVSPVVSRELLYTAVTRGRQTVTIYGTRDIVEHAIARRIARASGLRDLLWAP